MLTPELRAYLEERAIEAAVQDGCPQGGISTETSLSGNRQGCRNPDHVNAHQIINLIYANER